MFYLTKSNEGPLLTLTEKLIMQAKLGESSSELWHIMEMLLHIRENIYIATALIIMTWEFDTLGSWTVLKSFFCNCCFAANILWSHPVMIHTDSPILKPLTTLPSPLLFLKVKNIFQVQHCMVFQCDFSASFHNYIVANHM